jgi:hypothetical protein
MPPASDADEMFRSEAPTVIDTERDAVMLAASVTVTVNADVPALVGVPLIAPEGFSDRPDGNAPDVTAQLYGGVPAVAASAPEYAMPTVPPGSGLAVIDGRPAPTVMLSARVAVCPAASLSWTVKLDDPAAAGVPLIVPELESVSPAGSDPALTVHVYGCVPPLPNNVSEYA